MRSRPEHVPIADGYTQHQIALLERMSLGGAAAAFAIILSVGAKDGPLDFKLKWAIGLAVVAMPVLLALYVAKDAIVAWRSQTDSSSIGNLKLVTVCVCVSLMALSCAIVCIVWHMLGPYVEYVVFSWIWFAVAVGASVELSLVKKGEQPTSDGRNTG